MISTDEDTDLFAAGSSVLLPVRFRVPDALTPNSRGTIRLLAVIDGAACTDEVPFRVCSPRPAPESSPVDPARTLTGLLRRLLDYAAAGMPSRQALNPPAQIPGTNAAEALPPEAADGGQGTP